MDGFRIGAGTARLRVWCAPFVRAPFRHCTDTVCALTMRNILFLLMSHAGVALAGFAAGIYFLPILTAPPAPTRAEIQTLASGAEFSGQFRRDLKDSDSLHWGEGTVFVGPRSIALDGEIAPGPAYVLYLSPEFVETEAGFLRVRSRMAAVGDVKTFENFILPVPDGVDPAAFNSVVIWCEAFREFITAARYR